ncbi:MAG: DUF1800 domain-containing protein [Rubrivivax sp.]|nr:DUF1800 domain-containing protein [Rubrivivax sp.]
MVRRRRWLQGTAGAVAGLGTAAPAVHARTELRGDVAAAHALNRLGYGPRPGQLADVAADPRGWIEQQLQPSQLPLPTSLAARLRDAEIAAQDPVASMRELALRIQQNQAAASAAAATPPQPGPDNPVAAYVRQHQLPAAESRLLRALESPRQLEEAMVDFWFNHFNVFQGKNLMRVLVGHYEHFAIRPYAMGRFRDLLVATAHHPAMLYYLDNWQSVGPRPGGGPRGLNENYARELMELHTLGVDGGYTQQDVTELARMLTGWTIIPLRLAGPRLDAPESSPGTPGGPPHAMPGYWFNERVHDRGEKHWLGQTVRGQGQAEGEQALERLARHPATARHVSRRLVQYFVADEPDAALVDRLARVFLAEDGRIVPVLRALFDSEAFWAPQHRGAKFKTPYHYSLSALRACGASLPGRPALLGLAGSLAAQGMPLYGCATPDGWRNTESAWLNPDAMSKRIQFAAQLAGRVGRGADADTLLAQLGPLVTPATRTLAAESSADRTLASALVLAGPGMMRR